MTLNERFDLAALAKGSSKRRQVEFRPIGARLTFESALYKIVAQIDREFQALRPDILRAAERLRSGLTVDAPFDEVMVELDRAFAQVVRFSRQRVDSLFAGEARRHDETWMQQVNRVVGIDLKAVIRSDQVKPALDLAVQRNVALIRGLSDEVRKRVETTVIDLVSRGASTKELSKALADIGGFTRSRAKLISIDQSSSFNANLNEIRHRQAGITRYTWSTVKDRRVRPEHRAREGKTFRYDSPPPGGHPGQPIRCRCVARPVLDLNEPASTPASRRRASREGAAAVAAALGL